MNTPISLAYPVEKTKINDAYLLFDEWAGSKGYNYMDWYMDKAGYRNNNMLYQNK